MSRNLQKHLTEDEFIGFVLEELPEEMEKGLDQHLEHCEACAQELEDFYTTQNEFPEEEWAKQRDAFVANLREQIFGSTTAEARQLQPLVAETLGQRLLGLLRDCVLWDNVALAGARGKALRIKDGQAEGGLLHWRIVEDEVNSRLTGYGKRLRVGETQGPFSNRKIDYEVIELTSRVKTNMVAEAKRRLALAFQVDKRVDVALASNMISVGLDITRLGLMVVLGQPKMTAEYIQATSRVGRDDEKPGLVVTLLNIHKPRDRSHYERFEAYHESFYRAVEATSVTPFSPRAIDRGIAAVIVSLARLGWAPLTAPLNAAAITSQRASLDFVAETMTRRSEAFDLRMPAEDRNALRQNLRGRVQDLLDEWSKIAETKHRVGSGLQYQQEEGGAPPLLFDPLDPELAEQPGGVNQYKFKAHRSLRGVEPNVNLWVKHLNGMEVEAEEIEE